MKKYNIIIILLASICVNIAWSGGDSEEDSDASPYDEPLDYQASRIQESDSSNVRPIDDSTPAIDNIMQTLEQNQLYGGMEGRGKIIVNDRFGTRITEYNMRAKGSDYSLLEFTSSAEKGQKILRIQDKIYLYYPDAEQIITLNQSMFQQSVLDSDISYEDMAGDKSLVELYSPKLEGLEMKLGVDCYRIYLSAYEEREVSYPYQRIWVRRDTFTLQASELFTRRKILRKVSAVEAIQEVEKNRYIIKEATFIDVLKSESSTKIIFDEISIQDIAIKEFSINNLKF